MTLHITVPGPPQGKGRARFGNGRTYTPAKTVAYEGLIALAGQEAMNGRDLIERPIYLRVTAIFATPKSWSKKKRSARPIHWHTSRADLDNIIKAVGDGLNGIVWKDDSQIAMVQAQKMYGATPGLDIAVEPLP